MIHRCGPSHPGVDPPIQALCRWACPRCRSQADTGRCAGTTNPHPPAADTGAEPLSSSGGVACLSISYFDRDEDGHLGGFRWTFRAEQETNLKVLLAGCCVYLVNFILRVHENHHIIGMCLYIYVCSSIYISIYRSIYMYLSISILVHIIQTGVSVSFLLF